MPNVTIGDNVLNIALTPIPLIETRLFGKVTDEETRIPLSNVKVSLDGMVVYTNSQGYYEFGGLIPGGYTITFEKAGYETEVR